MILSTFKMAWESVIANKMRTFLTMLGIIIGVGAVIILVSLVQGATNSVQEMFDSFGTTSVTVSARSASRTRYVTYDDVDAWVFEHNDLISGFTPSYMNSATLKSAGDNMQVTITGTNGDYETVNKKTTQIGRLINEVDVKNRTRVVVLGEYNAVEFFGSAALAIGKEVKINGEPFTVVGVMERVSSTVSQGSQDDLALIPYTTAMKLFATGTSLNSFTLLAKDEDSVDAVMDLADEFMMEIFMDEDSYNISNLQEFLDQMDSIMGIMTGILGGIAAISLVVAGIGIMNIMLVSVTERTREIGVRKAIGAKRSNILIQFLIEAMTESLMGGIVGVIFGSAVSMFIGNLIDINAAPSASIIIISLAYSIAVGLFFGLYPANKASKLNPIEALRAD